MSFSLGSLGELKEDGDDSFKDGLIDRKTHEKLISKCREEDYLLNRLKEALFQKMKKEGTLPAKERQKIYWLKEKQKKNNFQKYLKELGLHRLEDGRYVKGERGERGEKGEKG